MRSKTPYRIAILGIGGVGGYVGGMLAAAGLPETEIIFIARSQTRDVLKQQGLKLITDKEEKTIHPNLVSSDPAEIGEIDCLICSVKGYDLAESLLPYKSCFTQETVILPFLNGIGIAGKIRQIIPGVRVWEGIIYVVARQLERGVIKQTGPVELIFGSTEEPAEDCQELADGLGKAGIKASVSGNIDEDLWKKFFFISVMATLTSYYNAPIGDIRNDPEKNETIGQLLGELEKVAIAEGIHLPDGLVAGTAQRIAHLPPDATSSMYADFQKGGQTEVDQLTGDVVRLGKQHGIPTPVYEKMYRHLKG